MGATALSVRASSLLLSCIPLFCLSQIAYREGLLTNALGVVGFLIAAVIHTMDVTTSVFGVNQSHRHMT